MRGCVQNISSLVPFLYCVMEHTHNKVCSSAATDFEEVSGGLSAKGYLVQVERLGPPARGPTDIVACSSHQAQASKWFLG